MMSVRTSFPRQFMVIGVTVTATVLKSFRVEVSGLLGAGIFWYILTVEDRELLPGIVTC